MKTSLIKKTAFALVLLALAILSNGQYAIFFAIWLFVPLMLFTVRNLKRWQGFLLAFTIIGVGYLIGTDVAPFLPLYVSLIITAVFSFLAFLPYLIDSFFRKKRSHFISTLIFPTAAVLIEYAYHYVDPFGTWWHYAYTQQSQYVLIQSISVFGLGYITFLIMWFASVVNWMYEQRDDKKNVKKALLVYGLVLALTLLYGGYRVQFQKPNSETIRVASISAPNDLNSMIDIEGLRNPETENEVKVITRNNTTKLNQYLFDKSIQEAQAGAKIVFWAEGNAVILKEDENDLYNEASKVATEQDIYLGISVAVVDPDNERFVENKWVLFNKNGNKIIDYWKGISVPGAEAPISNNKPVGIQHVETEYGILTGVICFDLDFPNYLKAAQGSDILLAPSNDYEEIGHLHTNMAKFRAIEQGFNLVRHASNGISIGTDYTGKVLSEMDHFADANKVLITQLPTKGKKTIYSMIGDSFIVICLALFVLVTILLRRKKTS
ncbi:MAG: hypothetical protein KTR22_08710 [Flavobacteriaceae bacterium]|nr:hypothetical protein [Flavobacteriaceae bacterium]